MDLRSLRHLYKVLFFCFLCLSLCESARACSCGGAEPCRTRQSYGMQFLGTVLRVRVVDNEHLRPDGSKYWGLGHRVVTISVVEDFSGRFTPGHLIEVRTGMGGGDCGIRFHEGERYLLDVTEQDGIFATGICMRTAPEGASGVFLRELRALAEGRRIPDVMGSVVQFSSNYGVGERTPVPVPDVPVTLTGRDGRTIHVRTGDDGVFALDSVAMGSYGVGYEVPKGLMSRDAKNLDGVNVPYTLTAGAGCELGFALYSAGRLQGRVVDAQGQGVHGSVSAVEQLPGSAYPVSNIASAATGTDGSFDLAPLDDGQYRILFMPNDKQRQSWWYPSTTLRMEAVPVLVKEGQSTDGLTITLRP